MHAANSGSLHIAVAGSRTGDDRRPGRRTCKVHREDTDGKLGVSSQAELSNKFITSVAGTAGHRDPD